MRDTNATIEWYQNHRTAREIGFDPDGMCLKVCRTARDIGSKHLSAKEAQDATPEDARVYKVRNLRRGMVAYFDDPNDSNRFGHIATMIGRVRGFDPDSLADCLFETNSVQAGRLTVVRGDYFVRYWGDSFVFGATQLNGVELDLPAETTRLERFHDGGPKWDLKKVERAAKNRPELQKVLDRIKTQVNRLPDSPKLARVREFKNDYRDERVLRMGLLDEAVRDGRTGVVKSVRDEIKRLIESLPDR